MSGASGIFSFPWFKSKAGSLQSNFNLPVPVAQSIVELNRRGYKFTVEFLQSVAASPPLQKLFTEGRIMNAANVGFPPEVMENLNRKLPFSMVIENKTFDLREKEASSPIPSGSTPPEKPSSKPPITAYVEPPFARAEREIEEAKEIPIDQISAMQPQEIINGLRAAWKEKDSLAFLVAFIKLMRFSFLRSNNEDIFIPMTYPDLRGIENVMQGGDSAGFYMIFSSGTMGTRWVFKSNDDPAKPYLVYLPGRPNYDYSDVFKKALDGCPGFKVDRGKYLYLYLE